MIKITMSTEGFHEAFQQQKKKEKKLNYILKNKNQEISFLLISLQVFKDSNLFYSRY